MEGNYPEEEFNAKFNMAIDTLKRLGDILREFKTISTDMEIDWGIKQRTKLILLRQFFVNGSPLMTEKVKNDYYEKIFNLKINNMEVYQQQGSTRVFKGYAPQFNQDVEDIIDKTMIDLQFELQKQKYFMPPAEEDGLF